MRKTSAPRLIGTLSAVVGTVVLALVVYAAGAGAAVGETDLVVTKTDNPDPVVAGNNLTYTISVQNAGASDASGVTVTDPLPNQVDFVSATNPCSKTGNTVTCNLGQVNAGTTQPVNIVVRPKKDGTLSNTATATATSTDTNLTNNSSTATTTVTKAAKGKKKGQASCATPAISGTPGNDVITGTSAGDVIVTDGGNDQVFAGG